jgi:nicotinamidase-related amidase
VATKALIVIDLQNDYFPGGNWPLHNIEPAVENAARLVAAVREAGDVLIHVRHEFPTADAPFFAPGTDGSRICDKVTPAAGEPVILKNHVNSFRETELKQLLDQQGVRDVTICGAMSHICIDAAVRAAHDFGYTPTVVHDACASRDVEFNGVSVPAEQVHAAFMAALDFGYATAVSTDEYLGATATAG